MSDPNSKTEAASVRLTEVLCALSSATDLANGNPLETTLRTCVIAVELAREAGVGESELGDVFYAALLRYIGCTAFAPEEAAVAGDDIAFKQLYAPLDRARKGQVLAATVGKLGAGRGVRNRARAVGRAIIGGQALAQRLAGASCEVGQQLAVRLRMPPGVVRALGEIHERYDGRGLPRRAAGEALSLPSRVVQVAVLGESLLRTVGVEGARRELRRRRGGQLDPRLVAAFVALAPGLAARFGGGSCWDEVLARAPSEAPQVDLETVALAFADFVDLKSAFTLGHSRGVADLAVRAAPLCGLDDAATRSLRLAALLHDLGRVGVATGIWDKPGPLNPAEWDRVHLHAHDTARILSRCSALAPAGALAGLHHERLDGSGYPHRAGAGQLSVAARILAAADAFQALTSDRAHRAARSPEAAGELLGADAMAGRFDRRAVDAVLQEAGVRKPGRRTTWPAGLTSREVEVLRRLVRGESNKEIAAHFGLSPRTVGHHALHIYAKLGVSSRAAAALFAIEHGLLAPESEPV